MKTLARLSCAGAGSAALLLLSLLSACRSASTWPPGYTGPRTFTLLVRSEGRPIPGAEVTLEWWDGRLTSGFAVDWSAFRTTVLHSDEAGVVSTTLEAREVLQATVRAPSYGRARAQRIRSDSPVEISLERETLAHGRVVDDLGRPVAQARVRLVSDEELVTDEQGAFSAHGLARGDRMRVFVAWGGSDDSVVPGETVTLTVPSGGFVTVRLFLPDRREPTASSWSCLLEERVGSRWLPATGHRRRVEAGRIGFYSLRSGVYRAVLRVVGVGYDISEELRVTGIGSSHGVTLHPRAGRVISGVVSSSEGPLQGALVRLAALDPDLTSARTDECGRFTLTEMPLEDSSLSVTATDFEPRTVPVVAGEGHLAVTLVRSP